MKLKNEKGFTLVDITVALIVLLLFMSVISVLFFNITKSSKGIERESQATYIATDIIEAYKSLDYDDVTITTAETTDPDGITISDGTEINGQTITILDGYIAKVKVENYIPAGETSTEDLVKKITVTVKYKLAAETKEVVLETTIARN